MNLLQFHNDYENRLIEVRTAEDDVVVEYTYNALGRQSQKHEVLWDDDDYVRFYYNKDYQVLMETDAEDTALRTYVYGLGLDEVLMMTDVVADEDYYYLHDHLKSPVALLDIDGEVLERYEYDAYGKATLWQGDYDYLMEGPSWYNNPYYFTGRRLDVIESGTWMIQYHRNRFYDYKTGRWLNQDPIGYQDGPNLYAYVHSNPVNRADSMGLCQADCDWFEPVEIKPWQQELIDTCIQRCEEDYAWYNPQRYACTSYCDNAATGTPDPVDNYLRDQSAKCKVIEALNKNTAVICGCAVIQVLDFSPSVGESPYIIVPDLVCSYLSAMGTVCQAKDNLNFTNVLRAEAMIILWGLDLGVEFTGPWSNLADFGISGLQNMIAGETTNPYKPQFDCLCRLGGNIQDGWTIAMEALERAEYELKQLLTPPYVSR